MTAPPPLQITLLPGTRELLVAHARALPQRDDLCGAFCGALALHAAGIEGPDGEPLDQDAVALAAGSVVSRVPDASHLPRGERGRRDYRLRLPLVDDDAVSGTSAAGVVDAVEQLSRGELTAIPYSGPWSLGTLGGLFDLAVAREHPATLIANLATRHLWGSHPELVQLLDYVHHGDPDAGPEPDWDVGHFVCILARVRGPRGSLYAIADTYPSLGRAGVHLQPQKRLVAAIERRDMPAGGVIAVLAADDAPALRAGAGALGLTEGLWENGTPAPAAQRAQSR